jgi:2-methylcitrate dehydratase PrpD
LIEGKAGEEQYSDRAVADPRVIALLHRIKAEADPVIAADEVRIIVTMEDGRGLEHHIAHAIGNIARPMTDEDSATKFHGLVDPVLGRARANSLLDLCRNVESSPHVARIAETARL